MYILINKSYSQVKDGSHIEGMIQEKKMIEKASNILVIDDLYSTGATLNEVCRVLRKNIKVKKIYCLAITKTKG